MQLLRAGVQNKNFTDSSVLCAQRSGGQDPTFSRRVLKHLPVCYCIALLERTKLAKIKVLLNSTFGYVLQRQEMQQEMA